MGTRAHKASPRPTMPLSTIVGTQPLLDKDLKPVDVDKVANGAPLVGLYFSAHWCGPCRAFTPKLVTFKQMLAEEDVDLPIIFASSDRDEAAMKEYFATMNGGGNCNFHAFPQGGPRINELKKKYGVSGIPWLVILDADGNLVLNEADTEVPQGPVAYKNWLKKTEAQPAA